jgi:anion-transporting  ArsA/GET3 family ATPase
VNGRLAQLVADKKLLICVGSGGVGKTTMAASIGLWAARRGRKVLVLTIDPARRLANALGLEAIGNAETRIEIGDSEDQGELWAMMLDTQTTFDDLIQRSSPDESTRKAILGNRIYQTLSAHFSGSQEYMAGEVLYDIVESGRYELVVLDTPPAKNALDFLEASARLSKFLDPRVIKVFLGPGEDRGFFSRFMVSSSAVLFRLLGYVFGKEFIGDFSEFLKAFEPMYSGFQARHEAVVGLLRQKDTVFLIVCAPNEPSIEVAQFFSKELDRRGLGKGATIVNQVLPSKGKSLDPNILLGEVASKLQSDLPPGTSVRLLARLGAAHRRLRQHAHIERKLIDDIRSMMHRDNEILVEVPRLEGEVHDLTALDRVSGQLFGLVKSI